MKSSEKGCVCVCVCVRRIPVMESIMIGDSQNRIFGCGVVVGPELDV